MPFSFAYNIGLDNLRRTRIKVLFLVHILKNKQKYTLKRHNLAKMKPIFADRVYFGSKKSLKFCNKIYTKIIYFLDLSNKT